MAVVIGGLRAIVNLKSAQGSKAKLIIYEFRVQLGDIGDCQY